MSEGLTMSQIQERNALLVTENEALKAQLDCYEKSATYSAETNRKLTNKMSMMIDMIDEIKAQRDALAAENAVLNGLFSTKEFSREVTDVFSDTAVLRIDGDDYHSWQWVDNDSEVIRAVLDAMKPETPATDAYLNSVRA